MKCALCGFEFDEKEAQATCRDCPLRKGCNLIRCPRCGYETPPEPRWLQFLKGKKNREDNR